MIIDTSSSVIPVIVKSLALALALPCVSALLEPRWGQVLDGSLPGGAYCLIRRPGHLPHVAPHAQLL